VRFPSAGLLRTMALPVDGMGQPVSPLSDEKKLMKADSIFDAIDLNNMAQYIYLVWPQRGIWLHRTTALCAGSRETA
jgi:hypothetical protein